MISLDVEQAAADDINRVTGLLSEYGLNATFFVVGGYYSDQSHILRPLGDYEVASKGWNQSEWADSYEDQRDSVKHAHLWMVSQGFSPEGFKAPFLRSNKETYQVLKDLGYTYDSSKTGLLPTRQDGIIELPLSVAYDPFWNEDVQEYLPLLYLAFENTYDREGLFHFYTLPEHTDESWELFLEYVQTKDVWIASGEEVAKWWINREKLTLDFDGGTAIVTNHGETPVKGVTLKTKSGYVELPVLNPDSTVRVKV
jgi:hypothetical protein